MNDGNAQHLRNCLQVCQRFSVSVRQVWAQLLWCDLEPLQATEALKITAEQLIKFKVMDHVIPEPLGGAHSDPMGAFPAIKKSLMEVYS